MAYAKSPFRIFTQFVLVVLMLAAFSFEIKSQTQEIKSQTQAEEKGEVEFVKLGQEINREIKALDSHSYKISLKTGQYLQLSLQTEKLALEVNLLAPSGENVFRVETDKDKANKETLEIVAKSTGTYLVDVVSLDDIPPSSYKIEVKELRQALLKDKNRCIAKELTSQADLLQKVGKPIGFEKSVERYLAAIPYWRKAAEQNALADTYRKLAESYYLISKHQESINYFTKELEIRRTQKNRSPEARAIKNLGVVYYAMGDDEQALKHYNQALALGKELNNRELVAQTLNFLATLYGNTGEARKSIELNKESLSFWEELSETEETVKITRDLAFSYYSLAEMKDTLRFYEKALIAAEKENNKVSQAKLLLSIATVYRELGDISHALNYYQKALSKWGELRTPNKESRTSEIDILTSLGQIYYKLNDTRQAFNSLEEALSLATESKNTMQQAEILNDLGNLYREDGEGKKAIEFYSDALMLHKQNNDLISTSITATEVGKTHLKLGDGDKAVGFFTEAYKLNQRKGNRAIEMKIFYNLGLALEFNYEEEKALASYKEGIIVAKELQDKIAESQFNYRFALLEKRRGNVKESQVKIERAIELIENLPSKVVSYQLGENYLSKATDYFELYIDILMQQHKLNPNAGNDTLALKVSEQERAYALLDLMTPPQIDFSLQGKDLVSKEKDLKQLISDKTAKLVKLNIAENSETEVKEVEKELQSLSEQLKELQTEIKQKNPHYANFSQPKPLNIKQIQEQVLDPETILLEYSLGNEQSYLWAVTQTEVKSFYLPKRSEIEKLAKYLRELITAPNLIAKGESIGGRPITLDLAASEYPKVAAELSNILLSPVADKLGKKRLVIVSDGALQYIPFSVLPEPNKSDTSQALLIDHEIVSLPSIATINVLREEAKEAKEQPKTVMFIADPVFSLSDSRVKNRTTEQPKSGNALSDLEENNLLIRKSAKEIGLPLTNQGLPRLTIANEEVKQISEIIPKEESKQIFNFDANLSNLSNLSKLSSSYRAIHFATYGLVNSLHPELSGLVLSSTDEQGNLQDGFLQTHKIFNLSLPTELVTLSNCDTTISKDAQEEGLTGLTRSFIYAGAKRVMASLWSTNDTSSAELMKKFYQKTLKENQSPSLALRAAQLEMLQSEKYKNPFYWAGFQLQGEWK